MSEDKIKKAVQEAKKTLEKESDEALKTKIKLIVKELLEKINKKEEAVKQEQKELSVLKKDLKDLESGRLDLIEERQKNDETAKRVSPLRVEKIIHEHHYHYENPRRYYYEVTWISPTQTIDFNKYLCADGTSITTTNAQSLMYVNAAGPDINNDISDYTVSNNITNALMSLTATGNNFVNNTPGTYKLDSGLIEELRPFFN